MSIDYFRRERIGIEQLDEAIVPCWIKEYRFYLVVNGHEYRCAIGTEKSLYENCGDD